MSVEKDTVISKHVTCNGGSGGLGHPKVYLHIGVQGTVHCPYCDKIFVYDEKGATNIYMHNVKHYNMYGDGSVVHEKK